MTELSDYQRIVEKPMIERHEARVRKLTDTIAKLRAEVEELKTENKRLTKAVGSGILNDLLTPDESDEFVKFIQFLRDQRIDGARAALGDNQ